MRQLADLELVSPACSAAAELVDNGGAHVGDRGPHGIFEQLDGVARRWRVELVGAVVGHGAVQPNQDVQVHQAAALVLGDLHERGTNVLLELRLRYPGQPRERTRDVDRRVAPELADAVVPRECARVVEAAGAERLTETRVITVVHCRTREPHAVRADLGVASWPAAPWLTRRVERARVHEPEARCREGDEHGGVLNHDVGDALAAAEAGADEVVGVLAVALRARRADGFAAVAARLSEDAVGFGGG